MECRFPTLLSFSAREVSDGTFFKAIEDYDPDSKRALYQLHKWVFCILFDSGHFFSSAIFLTLQDSSSHDQPTQSGKVSCISTPKGHSLNFLGEQAKCLNSYPILHWTNWNNIGSRFWQCVLCPCHTESPSYVNCWEIYTKKCDCNGLLFIWISVLHIASLCNWKTCYLILYHLLVNN